MVAIMSHGDCSHVLTSSPMQNDPARFVMNVAVLPERCKDANSSVIPYLRIAPVAPPMPIKTMFLNMR